MNKLNVIQDKTVSIPYSDRLKPKTFREATKARFEREWKKNPNQFNPMRNARERTRIERTIHFIQKHLDLNGLKIADLGSGHGHLTKKYRDNGGVVSAVDIAQNASCMSENEKGITPILSCVPNTHLEDFSFDLVACTELIGFISPREHRLFFNELARLTKRDGRILFSTSVDIHSEDALDKLIGLMHTEWEILDYQLSFHSRQIRLQNFFSMPRKFSHASRSAEERKNALNDRCSIWHAWFKWNSTGPIGALWGWLAPIANLIERAVKQSKTLLLLLEKLSHSEASISHIIILAKRKDLFSDTGN